MPVISSYKAKYYTEVHKWKLEATNKATSCY